MSETTTTPYAQFGENPNMVSEPLRAPGYPQTDVIPAATGTDSGNAVVQPPMDMATMMERLAQQNQDLVAQVFAQAEQNRALIAELQSAQKANNVPEISGPQGGAPVPHHLHLADGRVVQSHDGIGTHYSETLPDGTSRVTRIVNYYPAETVDPALLNN